MFGEWALVKIKGRYGDKGNEWLLLKHRDQYASGDVDVTEVAPRSVISNKDVDDIGGERTWESNRKASSRRAPTLADKLKAKKSPVRKRG
jgi:bifunctional non-homologous end joining protein LigD